MAAAVARPTGVNRTALVAVSGEPQLAGAPALERLGAEGLSSPGAVTLSSSAPPLSVGFVPWGGLVRPEEHLPGSSMETPAPDQEPEALRGAWLLGGVPRRDGAGREASEETWYPSALRPERGQQRVVSRQESRRLVPGMVAHTHPRRCHPALSLPTQRPYPGLVSTAAEWPATLPGPIRPHGQVGGISTCLL